MLTRIDRAARDHPMLALRLIAQFAADAARRADLADQLDASYVRFLVHERRGENELVRTEVEAGVKLAMRSNLLPQAARLLHARARIAQVQGRYSHAIEAWQHSLELAGLAGDLKTAVEARIGLAQSCVELGNPAEAMRHLDAARDDVEQLADAYYSAKFQINIGVLAVHHGEWGRALGAFRGALEHAAQGQVREYVAECFWHIGHAEMRLGERIAAGDDIQSAIELAQRYRYRWLESVSLDSLAELYAINGDMIGVITCLRAAYQLAEETASLARQLDYAAKLSDAYEQSGQLGEALVWARRERQLSLEHFRRSLGPAHRSMAQVELGWQDINERLLALGLAPEDEREAPEVLQPMLDEAWPMLGVDWIGIWLQEPHQGGVVLAADVPAGSGALVFFSDAALPQVSALINQLVDALPLTHAELHPAAGELARLLGQAPKTSVMLMPLRSEEGPRGLLVFSTGPLIRTWTRDDVFHATLIRQLVERWLAAGARSQLRRELERSERVSALGALVVGIAHELNTPLGVCVTTASVMDTESRQLERAFHAGQLGKQALTQFFERQIEASETLARNLERSVELVERFKQLRAQDVGDDWREVELGVFLRGLVDELAYLFAGRRVGVSVALAAPVRVRLPVMALTQIVTQLLSNAARHAFDERVSGQVTLGAQYVAGGVQLRYRDDGVGMHPSALSRLFDPFFTSQLGQGGNGLGMARVYQLVREQLHGTIRAESEPGQGLAITITWHEKGTSSAV
ncbi:tetratricopeptide repeat-containing sensor histidine kinase [Chitinibacteraceae bacterium HSL-7]